MHSASGYTVHRPRLRSPARRAATIGAVLAIHALLWHALVVTTARVAVPPLGAPPESLELLFLRPPSPEPPPAPPPALEAQAATPVETPAAPAAFVATDPRDPAGGQPPPGHADRLREETALDVGALSTACARAYPESAADLDLPGTVTLLVRVEANGRPSEVKVVSPSGSEGLDESAAACLMALGEFEPLAADGHAMPSWRRLQWPSVARRLSAGRSNGER